MKCSDFRIAALIGLLSAGFLTAALAAPAAKPAPKPAVKKPKPFRGYVHLQLGYLGGSQAEKDYFNAAVSDLGWVQKARLRPDPAFPTAVLVLKDNAHPDIVRLLNRLREKGIGVTGVQLTHFPAMKWVTQLGHMCGKGSLAKGITPAEGCARCRNAALDQVKTLKQAHLPSRYLKQHRIVTQPPRADIVNVGAYLDALIAGGKPAVSLVVLPQAAPTPEKPVVPLKALKGSRRKTGGSPTDPLVTMTIGHACCNRCVAAIYHALNGLPWAVETSVRDDWSYPRASVRLKPGESVDLLDLRRALLGDGMLAPQMRLAHFGAVRLTVGFAYLPGLENGRLPKDAPARRALERALESVDWAAGRYRIEGDGLQVKLRHADVAKPEQLIAALSAAGFPPTALEVVPGSLGDGR